MPASKAVCSAQIKRIAASLADPQRRWSETIPDGKTLTESSRIARKECGEALMRWAENDEHAIAIGTRILESLQYIPSPIDIRTAAEDVAPPSKFLPADPACPSCHGSGMKIETIRRDTGVFSGDYTAAGICDCRRKKASA